MPNTELEYLPFSDDHLDAAASLFIDVFAAEPWNETWSTASARGRLSDILESPGFLGVAACMNGELVGFVLGSLERYRDEEHFHLGEMCVSTHLQRQGIGTKLLGELQQELEKRGCKQIYLLTAQGTAPESFYLQRGFAPARRTIVMVKRLNVE